VPRPALPRVMVPVQVQGFFSKLLPCCIFTSSVYLLARSRGGSSMCLLARSMCLLARVRSLVDGSEGPDCRNCQTFAASPAEPGDSLGY
jgi:hypothetical protein